VSRGLTFADHELDFFRVDKLSRIKLKSAKGAKVSPRESSTPKVTIVIAQLVD
jgi:hypothetical protein